MTQHLPISRQWITETAAALVLAFSPALLAAPAQAGIVPSGTVYPRAAVSSEAYRTAPGLLSNVAARPIMVQARGQNAARQPVRDGQVRPVDHQSAQPAAGSAATYSVQAELQRIYAEEGRQMPQMAIPSTRQRPAAGTARTAPPRAQREEQSSGLLAGLFDFGRSRDSRRSSSMITRPPVEPEPFRPPTYRQQQARQQRQQQATQTPQQRTANVPSAQRQQPQQPTAQTTQSNSVIELKRVTPQRNVKVPGEAFFLEEDAAVTAEKAMAAGTAPRAMPGENAEELAEFFPGDVAAAPVAKSAADSPKKQLQRLLQDEANLTGSNADQAATEEPSATAEPAKVAAADQPAAEKPTSDGFQMPVETEAEIVPQPAPAVASDVVVTTVAPAPADGPAEPAPFFADAERAIDPNESMEISALKGQTFDPSGADSQATAGLTSDSQDSGSRMQQIAARDGVGLKGYCPVALRDERRLADGKAAYVSYYQGKAYYFSSESAKDRFDSSPSSYAPASGGEDLTMKTLTGEVVEGSLDHSVWYKGRLYLFHTAENLKTFMAAPGAMAVTQ